MKSFLCRYLLVYKHSSAAYSLASNRVMMFINRNRMVLLLVAYVIMLALIGKFIFFHHLLLLMNVSSGLSKSTTVQRWMRKMGWLD